jgi:hypothetical protein
MAQRVLASPSSKFDAGRRVKAGIELELVMLRNRTAVGGLNDADRADIELRLRLLLAHAKLRGWIVDKKQVSQVTARVSVPRGDLEAAIRADVERLVPGAMKHLEAGVVDADQIRAIAAGDAVVEPPA